MPKAEEPGEANGRVVKGNLALKSMKAGDPSPQRPFPLAVGSGRAVSLRSKLPPGLVRLVVGLAGTGGGAVGGSEQP